MTRQSRQHVRSGFSLLEMVISMTLLSIVMSAVTVVLRTSREAWEAHEVDHVRIRTAHASVGHIVRAVQEASEIVTVTTGVPTNTRLTVRLSDGDTLTWQHDASRKQILFTQTSVSSSPAVIAENIETLEFQPFRVDGGLFQPGMIDRAQEIEVSVGVLLPREAPVSRRAASRVWLRPFGRNRPAK